MTNIESPETAATLPDRSTRWRTVLSNGALLVFAPIASFLLTFFVFQTYQVEGMSMETTLQNHDRLIVWKAPQTLAHATDRASIPNRYDIIVFKKDHVPGMMTSNGESQLIKRVIGLPGERVIVSDGNVMVYNGEHPEGFNPDAGQSYKVPPTPGDVDTIVPNDYVFVLGDNRVNSYDSPDFGTVPAKDIVGTLVMRVAPLGHAQTF